MVASNKPFAPAYFDSRPMSQIRGQVPSPPERPYRLGEGASQVAAAEPAPRQAATVEFAAAARSEAAQTPAVTPVSAYAPVRDDGHAGFMSGRGLY